MWVFIPEMSQFETMRVFNAKQTATRIRNEHHILKASFGGLDKSGAGTPWYVQWSQSRGQSQVWGQKS